MTRAECGIDIGIRPFVELSFMPEQLASKDTYIFHWKGNTSPPKDYKKWEALVKGFVEHCVKRYGRKEVRKWYFEVWNEPNIVFWSGTQEEYWELYNHSAKAIKEVDPWLKVGGPASAGGEWVKEILEYCANAKVPIDFVSYHGYSTDKGYFVGGKPFEYKGIDYWRELAKANYEIVRSFDQENSLEIHVTEWNLTSRIWEPQHNTANGAAYCCQAINDVIPYVDTFSYWTISDIFREQGFPDKEFHGGFGLITIHGLRKPKYWAFELLGRLKGQRIPVSITTPVKGVGSIATKTREGLYVLIWYYNPEWDTVKEPVNIRVECSNLPFKDVNVTEALIDQTHSNIITIATEKGIKGWPTDEELKELKSLNTLYEEKSSEHIEEGRYNRYILLNPGSVAFFAVTSL
jgi:xylan 1,4-beta-xylosidase